MASPRASRLLVFIPSTPQLTSLFTRKNAKRRFFCTTGILFVAAVFLAGILTLSVFMGRHLRKRAASVDEEHPFCCPDEARDSFRYVNRSVDPCMDFFAYVCHGVIELRLWKKTSLQEKLNRIIITGVLPPNVRTTKAGKFLIAYHKSCTEILPHPKLFLSSIAAALVRKYQGLLGRVDRRHAFMYSMMTGIKYQLYSAVEVFHQPPKQIVGFRASPLCLLNSLPHDALHVSVREVNGALNTTARVDEVISLMANICKNISAAPQNSVAHYTVNQSDNFQRDVWAMDDLEAGMRSIGLSLGNQMAFQVYGAYNVRVLRAAFSNDAPFFASDVKAAYLVWHSVMSGMSEFYASQDKSPVGLFQSCTSSVAKMWHLQNQLAADVFTSPEKDAQASAVFFAIKKAVLEDSRSSFLFEAEDNDRLESFLRDLVLVTPAALGNTTVPLPEPTQKFADSLLSGRQHEFEANRICLQGLTESDKIDFTGATFLGHSRLYLHASMYSDISANTTGIRLPSMAILGRLLSEALWFMLLDVIQWTSGTVANIYRLKSCYSSLYGSSDEDVRHYDFTAVAARGLLSTLNAFSRPDWLKLKLAWSTMHLSHGMMFYILSTYAWCPRESSPTVVNSINVPLMHVKDFANVFNCSANSPMRSNQTCLFAVRNT